MSPRGTAPRVVIDDFTPAATWPPMFDGEPDHVRLAWLRHPDLDCAETRVAADMAVLVGRLLPRHTER